MTYVTKKIYPLNIQEMSEILKGLNKEQALAASTVNGPMLIIAGA
ncbi:MAG: hypothetical protein UW87_C0010G0001, partial [Candidatus Moranbacteria bacterium GW2011_GWC2_45_10]